MVSVGTLIAFALVSLGMVCSPGPNMIYLISRSITQGRMAGIISLLGVVLGFVIYIVATMFGLSALFIAVPFVYQAVKWAGAAYLLWLAWNAIKPGASSVLEPRTLSIDTPRKLFIMGFMTNLLNPKIAILYVSLLPQFENPARGSLLIQGGALGLTQIIISFYSQPSNCTYSEQDCCVVPHSPDVAAGAALADDKCIDWSCRTSCC